MINIIDIDLASFLYHDMVVLYLSNPLLLGNSMYKFVSKF